MVKLYHLDYQHSSKASSTQIKVFDLKQSTIDALANIQAVKSLSSISTTSPTTKMLFSKISILAILAAVASSVAGPVPVGNDVAELSKFSSSRFRYQITKTEMNSVAR